MGATKFEGGGLSTWYHGKPITKKADQCSGMVIFLGGASMPALKDSV